MPEQSGQGQLFETSTPAPEDVDAVAGRIRVAAAERPVPEPKPLSKVMDDLGYRRREGALYTDETGNGKPRLYELPGKDGRNNPHNQSVNAGVAQAGMSKDEIANQDNINKAGAAIGLEILNSISN